MSLTVIGRDGIDDLHPIDGWGDVPAADRPLWSRYMVDHLPWFPGVTAMIFMAPGVMNGGTRAPRRWKDAARALHAAGFAPADYYLLAELLANHADKLDATLHAHLFDLWPTDRERGPRTFRLHPTRWIPWLDQVRAGESPRRALEWLLSDGSPWPMGVLHPGNGEDPTVVW